jgi:hypothetical protein
VVTPGGYDLSIPTDQARLLYSDDDAVSWQSWPGGLPVEPACLNGMNLNYGTPDALYASTCQGIFVWENGAWVKRSDQVTNVIAVVHGQPEQIWAAVPWNGIIRSDDGGKSWRDASGGLMSFGGILALAVDPDDAHVRYAIIRPQYAGSYLRRSVGADEWQTMPTPEENSTIDTGMVLEGSTGSLYLTSQLAPAKIWRSDNPKAPAMENIAWQQVGTFGDANARLLASGWASQGLALYATVTPYNRQPDGSGIPGAPMLQRSVDGGRTWEVLAMP